MLSKEELRIIKITRSVPVVVLIISIIVILLLTEKNDQTFKNNLREMEEKYIVEGKDNIKSEVLRMHNYIDEERSQTVSLIKNNIKGRTKPTL